MPKDPPKITTRLKDSDYGQFPVVIDITMGEFAFSVRYPIHSDSYASCLGVVMGAVDASAICLAHLDPVADEGTLYKHSLDAMMGKMEATGTTQVDVVLFMDMVSAVAGQQLKKYLEDLLHPKVRAIIDLTFATGHNYDEVVVMPSSRYSAFVCLAPLGAPFDWQRGDQTVLRVATQDGEESANNIAARLGRAREVSLQGVAGETETVVGET